MYTEADKAWDDAYEHVDKAIKSLGKIVVDECQGSEDYPNSVHILFMSHLDRLVEIRSKLKRGG